jgi:hypothetical protein
MGSGRAEARVVGPYDDAGLGDGVTNLPAGAPCMFAGHAACRAVPGIPAVSRERFQAAAAFRLGVKEAATARAEGAIDLGLRARFGCCCTSR